MAALATPRTPDEITTAWLAAAFEAGGVLPGTALVDSRLEMIGEGAGFTSTIVRVHLGFEADHPDVPDSVIIKLPSIDPSVRAAATAADLFGRENTFYAHYPADGPGRPPRHYYSVADREKDDFILVIEDLGHARFVSQTEGAEREDALAITRTLGRIHACFRESPALDDLDWLPPFQVIPDLFIPTFAEGTPALLEKFGYLIPPEIQSQMDAGTDAYQKIVDRMMSRPAALVHGDARIENFAFETGAGPESVRLFDWAGSVRGGAAYDLAYFLGGSMDAALRRQTETALLEAYLGEMTAAGVEDFNMDDLRRDIRLSACLLFGFMSYVGTLIPPDDAGHALMGTMLPRLSAFMEDHDVAGTLKSL